MRQAGEDRARSVSQTFESNRAGKRASSLTISDGVASGRPSRVRSALAVSRQVSEVALELLGGEIAAARAGENRLPAKVGPVRRPPAGQKLDDALKLLVGIPVQHRMCGLTRGHGQHDGTSAFGL